MRKLGSGMFSRSQPYFFSVFVFGLDRILSFNNLSMPWKYILHSPSSWFLEVRVQKVRVQHEYDFLSPCTATVLPTIDLGWEFSKASNTAANDVFGNLFSLTGAYYLIRALGATLASPFDAGVAYISSWSSPTWGNQRIMKASSKAESGSFCNSVATTNTQTVKGSNGTETNLVLKARAAQFRQYQMETWLSFRPLLSSHGFETCSRDPNFSESALFLGSLCLEGGSLCFCWSLLIASCTSTRTEICVCVGCWISHRLRKNHISRRYSNIIVGNMKLWALKNNCCSNISPEVDSKGCVPLCSSFLSFFYFFSRPFLSKLK